MKPSTATALPFQACGFPSSATTDVSFAAGVLHILFTSAHASGAKTIGSPRRISLVLAQEDASATTANAKGRLMTPNVRDQRRRAVGAPLGRGASGVTTSAERCIA